MKLPLVHPYAIASTAVVASFSAFTIASSSSAASLDDLYYDGVSISD